jgi:ribosomal protein S17
MIKRAKTIHKVTIRKQDVIKRLMDSNNQVMLDNPTTKEIEIGDHLLVNYTDPESKQRLSLVREIVERSDKYIWVIKIQSK